MPLAILLPLLLAAALIGAMLRAVFYRPNRRLDDVIQLVRKLEIQDLSRLLDPAEEWALRSLCQEREFRLAQRERIRLALEYLRRIGHNAELLQTWAGTLYETIRLKPAAALTPQDHRVRELLELATDIRVWHLGAIVKVGLWMLLHAHRWPIGQIPRIAAIRKIGEYDIVSKYRLLVELSASLSETYGDDYCRQLLKAL